MGVGRACRDRARLPASGPGFHVQCKCLQTRRIWLEWARLATSGPGLCIWSSLARSGPIGDDRARLVSGPGQACLGTGPGLPRDRARLVGTGPGLPGKVQIAGKGVILLEWAKLAGHGASLARSGPIGDDRAGLVSGPGQACRDRARAATCRGRGRPGLGASGPGLARAAWLRLIGLPQRRFEVFVLGPRFRTFD